VQSCSIKEYIEVLQIESEAYVNSKSAKRRSPPLFTLEKKFYDLSGDITTPEQLVTIVKCFGYLEHKSDTLWEILTKAVANIVQDLSPHQLSEIVVAYGVVKRGSNQLWDFFTKCVNTKFDLFS